MIKGDAEQFIANAIRVLLLILLWIILIPFIFLINDDGL